MMCAVAALLVVTAVKPATADDISVCEQATGDDAIAACTRMLALNPKNPDAYATRGLTYSQRGDYDHAISAYDEAIRLDPKNTNVYIVRGAAYSYKGDYDHAISDCDQAIRLDPKNADAYNTRGEAYEAKNDLDHAIADFDQALKLDPSLAQARQSRERVQGLLAKRCANQLAGHMSADANVGRRADRFLPNLGYACGNFRISRS